MWKALIPGLALAGTLAFTPVTAVAGPAGLAAAGAVAANSSQDAIKPVHWRRGGGVYFGLGFGAPYAGYYRYPRHYYYDDYDYYPYYGYRSYSYRYHRHYHHHHHYHRHWW